MAGGTVAIFGLGAMGMGMAEALLRAGQETHGFDINADAVARFQGAGGAAGALADVASTLDAVVIVVLNAAQTEAVLFGDAGIAAQLAPGAVVIACATVPPDFAREMAARCAALGLHYLDAPISGGSVKAAAGQLSIMASGTAAAFAARAPRAGRDGGARCSNWATAPGAGSAMKAVNQMLAGVHIAAMAEALTFGMTQGVEPAKFVEVIRQCAGTSWMLENRAPHVVDGRLHAASARSTSGPRIWASCWTSRRARSSAPR